MPFVVETVAVIIVLLLADVQTIRGLRQSSHLQQPRKSLGFLSVNYNQYTLRRARESVTTTASNSVVEEHHKGQHAETRTNIRIRSTATEKTNVKLARDILALETFFSLHGHYRVPYTYVIPNGTSVRSTNGRIRRKSTTTTTTEVVDDERCVSDSYPSETHGLRLGLRVARIRKGELYTLTEQRAKLKEIGLKLNLDLDISAAKSSSRVAAVTATADDELDAQLQWSARAHATDQKFQVIMSALQVHYELYGDMLVPRYFVVPAEEPWSPEAWDMQLGNRVRNIRARRAYNKPRYHQQLTEVGFVFTLGDCQIPTSWSSKSSHKQRE